MTENLDCMFADDLMSFWQKHNGNSRKRAAELFGRSGPGTVKAMRDCANYASNKATAMQCRLRGDIQGAQMYEGICDKIYSGLPDFARW